MGPPPRLHRWTINTAGSSLSFRDETRTDRVADLPTIDRRYTGRAYRYGWRVEVRDDPDTVDMAGVVRDDARTGREQRWVPPRHVSSGEWLFVPTGKDEGDGFVLSYVHDRRADRSELVVLDARDVAAGPLARVTLPQRVPYGFHATWVPASES
jgi:carotenoid cleavage dioxygenase